ncbi:MAG: hypothetical protein GX279_08995 [Clostridiaceae bacterium]|nr:hypothetical protein [Clostridiaceae bacterium]
MDGRRKRQKRIVICHTGREKAGDIRLKLLRLVSRGTRERASYNGELQTEQYRDLCQDKQR